MKEIIQTRLLHLKKQWILILFWLLFPIFITILFMFLNEAVQEDTSVPVGIVLEEDTTAANDVYESITQSSLLDARKLPEKEAMHQLTKHELDSVFIIHEGFAEKIKQDDRHQLTSSYRTELSFAYPTIKEQIVSLIQQETGRSKAVQVIESLAAKFDEEGRWSREEIIVESESMQKEYDLLRTQFSFESDEKVDEKQTNNSLINIWNIWAISVLLATLLLFDWPSKEAHSKLRTRFAFIRMTMKQYLLQNLLLYIGLFMIVDLTAIGFFNIIFNESISLFDYGTIVTYRLMICVGAFLLSLCFKRVYTYYLSSLILVLLMGIGSGVILPIDRFISRFPSVQWLNPLNAFVSNQLSILWLFIFIIITIIWYVRKERTYASR